MDTFFGNTLIKWYKIHKRDLPWRETKDPYKIWLSEIILQQTRVEQGTAYYEKFTEKYPTIENLATAPEKEVMKLWEGLGYYARCKNLHATAKIIAFEKGGEFPDTYEELLK
ncbi:MAG: A/G-specific adenine glycosylase, partial [Sphingobacteriaceae bacterium]